MIIYNCRKLLLFKDSPFCFQELRDKDIGYIYQQICSNLKYLHTYNMFCSLRWKQELSRRRISASSGDRTLDIEEKLRLQERLAAINAIKQEAKKMEERQTPITNMIKDYHKLFSDTIDESQWNPLELEIRKLFMAELSNMLNDGVCTSCERTRLVRKYIELLKALLS